MSKKLITPGEVADLLGVTPETLAVWRCTGRYGLPFIKVGRKVLYDQDDVNHFIDSRRAVKTA